jgi:hypothetical protein
MEPAMREDIGKVLVEEPRHGRAQARALQGSRRKLRHRLDPDGEGGPVHVGMRRDAIARKHFGEHLGPLYRYLRQQVNRPWDKVYGELCGALDRRNVVQNHLFQHIGDRVALETVLVDGEVRVRGWRGTEPLGQTRYEMYVHPRTGILLVNRAREKAAHQRRLDRMATAREPAADRRVDIPGLAPDRQWHRIDGIWYEVRLQPLSGEELAYDLVLKRPVSILNRSVLEQRYGHSDRYAAAKRQLDSRTLARHRLR